MKVEILNCADSACDAFVRSILGHKICYLYQWTEMLSQAMSYRPFYLVARSGTRVRGVLPMMQCRSFLFGNRMISQAFSNYGGMLTDCSEAREALFTYAVELATKLNCESIEFRNIKPLPYDLQLRPGKMCMHLFLTADPDQMWKSFKAKVRNQVRKAEKSNITAVSGGRELLDEFYRVYIVRMHQLGSPAYPHKLMKTILTVLPDGRRIFTVRLGELTIGAGFVTCLGGFVESPWAATLNKYNSLCPNNLLYWSVIKYYCLAGAKCFDFGRCTVGGPTHRFKKQWGPEPVDLHYQYWVRPGHQLPILSPDNPKYKRRVEIWKKLPLWVTRIIGPYIGRSLP